MASGSGPDKPSGDDRYTVLPRLGQILAAALLLALAIAAWVFRQELQPIIRDPSELRELVAALGWYGPLLLITVNVIQIVIAPIPGYAVYVAAGLLYGTFWGGVWGSVGLLLGGTLSMWLARRFGRPLVLTIVGTEQLRRWEAMSHSDSSLVWGIILLSPVGDMPFFLAGLSRVTFAQIVALTILTRVPMAFLAAALGGGVFDLNWWQIIGVGGVLLAPLLLFSRYQGRIEGWLHARTAGWRSSSSASSSSGTHSSS